MHSLSIFPILQSSAPDILTIFTNATTLVHDICYARVDALGTGSERTKVMSLSFSLSSPSCPDHLLVRFECFHNFVQNADLGLNPSSVAVYNPNGYLKTIKFQDNINVIYPVFNLTKWDTLTTSTVLPSGQSSTGSVPVISSTKSVTADPALYRVMVR